MRRQGGKSGAGHEIRGTLRGGPPGGVLKGPGPSTITGVKGDPLPDRLLRPPLNGHFILELPRIGGKRPLILEGQSQFPPAIDEYPRIDDQGEQRRERDPDPYILRKRGDGLRLCVSDQLRQ